MKKLSIRKIDNSSWIYNFFVTSERIYFINSFFKDKASYLCYINKHHFMENLKTKRNIDRSFLYCPYNFNDAVYLSITDVILLEKFDDEIINIFEYKNEIYLQFMINNNVITKKYKQDKDSNEFSKFKNSIIKIIDQNIYILNEYKNLGIYDFYLNKIEEINLNSIDNFIVINKKIFLLSNNNIFIYFEKKLTELVMDNYNKNIFPINENNLLITNYDNNETIICNIDNFENNVLFDFSLIKAIPLDKVILLYIDSISGNIGLLQ